MLLGDPPLNDTDVSNHWSNFFDTITDDTQCCFINHPKNLLKTADIEHYIEKYDYLKKMREKISNFYICNTTDLTYIHTQWSNVSIVYAELIMLQYAYINWHACKYILISSTCCPLYNFNVMYNTYVNDTKDKSWFSFMGDTPGKSLHPNKYAYDSGKSDLIMTSYVYNYFSSVKISQWIALDKKHVSLLFLSETYPTYRIKDSIVCEDDNMTTIELINQTEFLDESLKFDDLYQMLESINVKCKIIPFDEFAIQQYILNKIINSISKTLIVYLKELDIKLLEFILRNLLNDNFFMIDIYKLEILIKSKIDELNEIYPKEEVGTYIYNKYIINEYLKDSNKIFIDNSLIKTPLNSIYLGYSPTFYPCSKINTSSNGACYKIKLNEFVSIGSTYTNWMFVTINSSTIKRIVNFRKFHAFTNYDYLQKYYISNIKKNMLDMNSDSILKFFNLTEDLYESSNIFPKFINRTGYDIKYVRNIIRNIYDIYCFDEIEKIFNQVNEIDRFDQIFQKIFQMLDNIMNLTLHGKEIAKYYIDIYIINILYNNINNIYFKIYSGSIKPEYHPIEYSIEKYDDFKIKHNTLLTNILNIYTYINKFLYSDIELYGSDIIDVLYFFNKNKDIIKSLDMYKLCESDDCGLAINNDTIKPIILSGSMFVRKCGEQCKINNLSIKLFERKTYIFNNYNKILNSDVLYGGNNKKKYLKYFNKLNQFF
jgi:hypothetical protein